jgi:hypothetical protein
VIPALRESGPGGWQVPVQTGLHSEALSKAQRGWEGGRKEQKGQREGRNEGRKERGRVKSALATQEAEIRRITR